MRMQRQITAFPVLSDGCEMLRPFTMPVVVNGLLFDCRGWMTIRNRHRRSRADHGDCSTATAEWRKIHGFSANGSYRVTISKPSQRPEVVSSMAVVNFGRLPKNRPDQRWCRLVKLTVIYYPTMGSLPGYRHYQCLWFTGLILPVSGLK